MLVLAAIVVVVRSLLLAERVGLLVELHQEPERLKHPLAVKNRRLVVRLDSLYVR